MWPCLNMCYTLAKNKLICSSRHKPWKSQKCLVCWNDRKRSLFGACLTPLLLWVMVLTQRCLHVHLCSATCSSVCLQSSLTAFSQLRDGLMSREMLSRAFFGIFYNVSKCGTDKCCSDKFIVFKQMLCRCCFWAASAYFYTEELIKKF